jgi:hypothetical protein
MKIFVRDVVGYEVARLITPGESQQFHKIQIETHDPQKEYGEALNNAQKWFDLKSQGVQTNYILKHGYWTAMIHQFYGKFTRKAQKEAAAKIGAALGIK